MASPEVTRVPELTTRDLRPEALARAQARGLLRSDLIDPDGHPTRAAAVALGRPHRLLACPWASVVLRQWPCREIDASRIAPVVRTSSADVATHALDLGVDLGALAPIQRDEVAAQVVQELIVNALVHRSLSDDRLLDPVIVEWFTDGFRVRTPSTPGSGSINLQLHALVAALGLARQQGHGLRYVGRSARIVGWRTTTAWVGAEHVAEVLVDGDAVDAAQDGQVRHVVALADADLRVLQVISDEPQPAADLATLTGLPASTTQKVLNRLVSRGLVRMTRPAARSRYQAYFRA